MHRGHDEFLVARFEAGDVDRAAEAAAESQLAACEECRALLADLQAIRISTNRATLRVPPSPRSFRLSPAELERYGGASWRRWLAGFGTPRFDLARPLATVIAGLGLVVMVAGSVSWIGFGGAASAPAPLGAETPAAEAGGAAGTPLPSPAPLDRYVAPSKGETVGAASPPPAPAPEASASAGQVPSAQAGVSAAASPSPEEKLLVPVGEAAPGPQGLPLVPIGAAVLASGLALFVLNTAARRAAGR